MKKIIAGLALLLACGFTLQAQITVEIQLEQDQYLRGESIPLAVRITNRSGQTLRLGEDDDWLTFSAASETSGIIPKLGNPLVAGAFTLESGKVAIKRLDIAPFLLLEKPGRYSLTASVLIKQWSLEQSSPRKYFDVIEGSKLWQQEFGVPLPPGAPNQLPEVRMYILQQANYLKGQLRLYVRVTDSEGSRTIKVQHIGPMLSFSRPEAQVDSASNLHVLYQHGPRSFSHTKYNPDGELLARSFYDYTAQRPRLASNSEGIVVRGGERRVSKYDIPPPPPQTEDDGAPPAASAAPAVSAKSEVEKP